MPILTDETVGVPGPGSFIASEVVGANNAAAQNLDLAEPPAGFIDVYNYVWLRGASDEVPQVQFVATASALDPWGRWFGATTTVWVMSGAGRATWALPVVTMMRGMQYRVVLATTGAARTPRLVMLGVRLRGEALITPVLGMFVSEVRT